MTMRVFIGMETSGQLRRRFEAAGQEVFSCDLLPSVDNAPNHLIGDVFAMLDMLASIGWKPDVGVFHPDCTFHTVSAAWAFKDADFVRYPGVGYHQRVKPGTLTGAARREAREKAEQDVEHIRKLPFYKVVENPIGTIPTRLGHIPADIVQPYQFGDDASKGTCFWAWDANGEAVPLTLTRTTYHEPRLVCDDCKVINRYGVHRCGACRSERLKPRWSNQSDNGQNRLGPDDDRWSERSRTYDGIADALVSAVLERLT